MRVLIVDDHEFVRRGIRDFLGNYPGWEICGEAVDGADALAKAKQLTPDIVIMDISMPQMNGLEAARHLRTLLPNAEILILSQHESAEMARQALQAGARGYVVKASVGRDLLNALDKVSRHELFFDPMVLGMRKTGGPLDVQDMESRSALLEQALRDSEELYRSTFELAPIGVAHLDLQGKFLRVNKKFAEIVGYSASELLRLTYQHITHPVDLSAEIEDISKLPGGDASEHSTERRYIRKDGSSVWVMRTAAAVRDSEKHLKHFIFIVEDITERKEADLARFRLAAIVESSDDAIVSKDLQGVITSWNAAAQRIFGYTPEEAVGKSILLIVPPELHPEETGILRQIRAGQRIEHFDTVRVRKDGTRIQVSLTISPVKDSRGRIVGASKIARDVTERKRAEAALQEGEQRLRLAQAAAQIGTWEWDPIRGVSSLSADLHQFFGTDPSDPDHVQKWFSRVHAEDIDRVKQAMEAAQRTGELEFEYRYHSPGHGLRSFYCKGRRFSPGDARMFGVVIDVTEQRRAAEALRRNEERLRAAFTQSYAFMVLLDVDGTIIEVNEAALAAVRATRTEVIGKKIWEPWWGGLPDEVKALQESLRRAARGESVREECSYQMHDGSIRFAERTINPIKDEKDRVVLLVATGLDMTEQKELRESLEDRVLARTQDLEEKNAQVLRQSELVRELSARLMQSQDEERRRIARELHDSAGQILTALQINLVSAEPHFSILPDDISRSLKDSIEFVAQLSKEIRTISYLLHPPLLDESGLPSALRWYIEGFAERSKITTELDISPELGRLPREMELAIFRVVQESLTNIHRHSGSSTAQIRVDRGEKEARVEIRDQGKGMPSGNGTSPTAKAGVGLRGMQERVRQFGGQLVVHSDNSGTTVIATLPIPEPQQASEPSLEASSVR